jgi:dethiobiotin synthetase
MAAEELGVPAFDLTDLLSEMSLPVDGVTFVEGVGGPHSPLARDADTVALTEALDADRVILVAEPTLGVINAVLLAAAPFGQRPVTVFLNRYDGAHELHERNRRWLQEVSGLDVVVSLEELAARSSNGG